MEGIKSVIYWRLYREGLTRPIHMSDHLLSEDAMAMADSLSKKHNCVVLLQKIRTHGYGEVEVEWQRYLINGLDSFRNEAGRKADIKKKTKISKNRPDIRPAVQGKTSH